MKSIRHTGSVEATDELYALACGPDNRIQSYPGCIVNGVRYIIEDRDKGHVTQNCGIFVSGENENTTNDFYGVLKDVIQLNYMFNFSVVLFQCVWFDTNVKKKRIQKDYDYTSIDVSREWFQCDPYILAIQAEQVFYLDDHKFGSTWKVVQKIQHRHIWDIPEMGEEFEMDDEIVDQNENNYVLDVEEEDIDDHQFHRKDTESETILANQIQSGDGNNFADNADEEDETLVNYNSDDGKSSQSDDDSDIDT